MTLRQHASILLGSALIASALAAQEVQHTPTDSHEFRISRITLPGISGKPVSIKIAVEHIEPMDGKEVTKHWEEDWVRDTEGRVWVRARAPREAYPGKVPPVTTIWLFDAAAENSTQCSVAERKCWVNAEHPSSTTLLFPETAAESSSVCWVAEGECQIHEYHESVRCGEKRFVRTFVGTYSIGVISMGRTRVTCYKPDGSGAGVELWHNSEFDIDFAVLNLLELPPRKVTTYYWIDQISSSLPDDPKLFQVPLSGYSFQ
ncbi:MAG TPA: hypothetical protein VEK33_15760 [Terriglobales bacterium]|nr:hypothetical protein [Terriglobales bacterium]